MRTMSNKSRGCLNKTNPELFLKSVIDYIFVSEKIIDKVTDCEVINET